MFNFRNNLLYYLQLLTALLSQRRQVYTEDGNLTIKSKRVTTLSKLLNNYNSKFIGVSSTLCRYSVITFLTVYLLYPVIQKHHGCTNSRWQITVATTFCTVVPNFNVSSLWNSYQVTLLASRTFGRPPRFLKHLCNHANTSQKCKNLAKAQSYIGLNYNLFSDWRIIISLSSDSC